MGMLLAGLHTTATAEEWAGSITTGRRTGMCSACNLSKGKETRQRGSMASVIQLLDILPKGKASAQSKGFSGTLLIAESHMEPRASLLLLKTLTGAT